MGKQRRSKGVKAKPKQKKAKKSNKVKTAKAAAKPNLKVAALPKTKKATASQSKAAEAKVAKSKISPKLLDALESRSKKKEASDTSSGNPFAKPPARRGRRPKRVNEYVPYSEEDEDQNSQERTYKSLEYDTGIKFDRDFEDNSLNFERSDDYDEELNFDW